MKNVIISSVAVVVTILGVSYFGKPVVNVTTPTPVVNVDAPRVTIAAPEVTVPPTVVNVPKTNLSGVGGPDFYFDYFGVNGVREFKNTKEFTTSTTTVCAIKSPNATSTLISGGALFTTSSTTASIVTIAKSATAFATTTVLGQGALAANSQGFLLASTTATTAGGTGSNLNPAYVFGPSQWLVVGMQGGTGTFSPVGQCQASFEVWQ